MSTIEAHFANCKKYGPEDHRQLQFETDLAVLVSKETSLPLSIVNSPYFRILALRGDPRLVFPDRHRFTNIILPRVAKSCKDIHTTPFTEKCVGAWLTFDLWMKGGVKVDVFGLNAHIMVDPCDFGVCNFTRAHFLSLRVRMHLGHVLGRACLFCHDSFNF